MNFTPEQFTELIEVARYAITWAFWAVVIHGLLNA